MIKKIICVVLVAFLLIGCTKVDAANQNALETIESTIEETIPETTEIIPSETIEETIPETEPEPTEPPIIEKYSSVPMFFQTDYPYTNYGWHGSVATHGCGIASLAMVASYLNDKEILPDELANKYGHYNTECGSSWMLFPETAEELGIVMEKQTWKWSDIEEALKAGKVIIANANEHSPFTSGGHFVVLTGITDDGRVMVNDPYKGNYGQWSSKTLKEGFEIGFEKSSFSDCFPMWIYAAKNPDIITNTIQTKAIKYEIISNENTIPYYMYSPSIVNKEVKTPLIIWLHGAWEKGLSELAFTNISLPKVFNNWVLDEFNAYVVCPQLKDELKTWNNEDAQSHIERILAEVCQNYNIDTEKIIIMGQGIGAAGAIYLTQTMPDIFSKAVSFSLYNPKIDITNTSIPIKFYSGVEDNGEDAASIKTTNNISEKFNNNFIINIPTSQAQLPELAINTDKDNNNQSDLIEWLLK